MARCMRPHRDRRRCLQGPVLRSAMRPSATCRSPVRGHRDWSRWGVATTQAVIGEPGALGDARLKRPAGVSVEVNRSGTPRRRVRRPVGWCLRSLFVLLAISGSWSREVPRHRPVGLGAAWPHDRSRDLQRGAGVDACRARVPVRGVRRAGSDHRVSVRFEGEPQPTRLGAGAWPRRSGPGRAPVFLAHPLSGSFPLGRDSGGANDAR